MTISRISSHFRELSCHDWHKFFIVDESISVLVGVIDHLINFCGWERLSHTGCHSLEVLRAKGSGSIGIKDFEKLVQGGFWISVSTKSEDLEEGGEINLFGSGVVVDNGEDLLSLIVESKCSDSVNEFIRGDISTVIVVKDVETVLNSLDIILLEVFVGIFFWIKALNYWIHTLLIFVDMNEHPKKRASPFNTETGKLVENVEFNTDVQHVLRLSFLIAYKLFVD